MGRKSLILSLSCLVDEKELVKMILNFLSLQNFRSYAKKEFKFPRGTTLIVGPNTSGKTNLLEAIYLMATGKSFRAGVEAEMIQYGEEVARINIEIARRNFDSSTSEEVDSAATVRGVLPKETIKLEIVLTTGRINGKSVAKKGYLVNGVRRRRMDFAGQLRCVLFGSEDLEIVLGSPAARRSWLDGILEQIDREYRRANLSYQKGLRQRNKLLEQIREEGKPRSILFFWDKLLVENGEVITQKRAEFIDFINQQPDYFDQLQVEYEKSIVSPQRLEKYARQETAAGMTLVGPHRDELRFIAVNSEISEDSNKQIAAHRDLAIYGSRGEQRAAVLSLKLAELEFMTREAQDRPVLLLDDIFSELDQAHRARVLEVISKQQTIMTTTELDLIAGQYRKGIEIIKL